MLRALEVEQTASAVAAHMRAAHASACRLPIPARGAFTYQFDLHLQRTSAAGVEADWTEHRVLRRDSAGNLALTMQARAQTELGQQVQRTPQWRIVGDQSYVSVDGQAFYRRAPGFDARARLMAAGTATLQTLLDAVASGWSRQGAHQWTNGGRRLICGGRQAHAAGWLRRFATRATTVSGTLRTGKDASEPRRLMLNWKLEDGSTLTARFSDAFSAAARPVAKPAADEIVEVRRDRSFHRVDGLLDQMASRHWIERAHEK